MNMKRSKAKEYQLLVARNFLRNISLDGTHEDTALRIFNRPGLPSSSRRNYSCSTKEVEESQEDTNNTADSPVFAVDAHLDENNVLPPTMDPPEIQVESPRSAGPASPSPFIPTTNTGKLNGIPESASVVPGHLFKEAQNSRKPSVDFAIREKRNTFSGQLLKKGNSSPSLQQADQRKLSWRNRLQQHKSSKGSNTKGPQISSDFETSSILVFVEKGADPCAADKTRTGHGKKTLESSKSLSKDSNSQKKRKISSPPLKSPVKGSFEGINIIKKKLSNFLSPPSDPILTSKNSSSNVSAASLDTNRSEDSLSVASGSSRTSRGEMRFLTSLKSFNFKNDRELADSKRSHHKASSDIEGLKPFDLGEDQEISYSEILVPYGTAPSTFNPQSFLPNTGRSHPQQWNEPEESKMSQRIRNQVSFHVGVKRYSRSSSCGPSSNPASPKVKQAEHHTNNDDTDEEQHPLAKTYHFGEMKPGGGYDPNLLDNPEFGPGQHKTTLSFSGYITSIFDYVDPGELKKEGNEKFKQKFGHVDLTCSKFKSIKREMRRIILDVGFDLLTLAQSYVYFEKIVLKGLINKQNRKLVAAVCLILAAKLNDSKGEDLENMFTKIESTFRISKKEYIPYELPVAVELDFSLHVPDWEIYPHYQKLIWTG